MCKVLVRSVVVVMSERNNRKVTYLTDAEARQLAEWAAEVGKSESALLREAILEYLDQDRTARIENRLDRIEDQLAQLTDTTGDDDTHTHMRSDAMQNAGSSAVERARKIVRRLQNNHEDVIKNDDVERAIEDIAGVDDRTIRKYKRLFKRRGILYEHPGETAVWTVDGELWCDWLNDYANLNGQDEAKKVAGQYPARVVPEMDGTTRVELQESAGL